MEDLIWEAEADRQGFPRAILGPQEELRNWVSIFIPVMWADSDIEEVANETKRRAVYGFIRYGNSMNEYWTPFSIGTCRSRGNSGVPIDPN